MVKRKSLHREDDFIGQRHTEGQVYSNDSKKSKKDSRSTQMIYGRDSSESLLQDHTRSSNDGQGTDNKGTSKQARKIVKLLNALDEILLLVYEDGEEPTYDVGQEALLQCERLRITLAKLRPTHLDPADAPAATTHSVKSQSPYLDPLLLQAPSPSLLTPWTASSISSTLPPLPPIKSPVLERATFTHRGVTAHAGDVSYERLEWIGDGYIYLLSCLLVSSTFPSHSPGKSSQLRELCVKNETLASYARAYGFAKRAHLPIEFQDTARGGFRATESGATKVLGDIFEAYVAAVVLSDPDHGLKNACAWLKALWARTLSSQITDQMRHNAKAAELETAGLSGDADAHLNPKVLLMKKIGSKGIKLQYKDAGPETKDPKTGFPVFTVGVYLDGWGEVGKQLGVGKAMKKTEAGNRAAEMVLGNKFLMSKYEMMKKLHDEKVRAAKELNGATSCPGSGGQIGGEKSPASGI